MGTPTSSQVRLVPFGLALGLSVPLAQCGARDKPPPADTAESGDKDSCAAGDGVLRYSLSPANDYTASLAGELASELWLVVIHLDGEPDDPPSCQRVSPNILVADLAVRPDASGEVTVPEGWQCLFVSAAYQPESLEGTGTSVVCSTVDDSDIFVFVDECATTDVPVTVKCYIVDDYDTADFG